MRFLVAATAVACLAGMGIAIATPKVEEGVKTVKIMPLGDSITGAPVGIGPLNPSRHLFSGRIGPGSLD